MYKRSTVSNFQQNTKAKIHQNQTRFTPMHVSSTENINPTMHLCDSNFSVLVPLFYASKTLIPLNTADVKSEQADLAYIIISVRVMNLLL